MADTRGRFLIRRLHGGHAPRERAYEAEQSSRRNTPSANRDIQMWFGLTKGDDGRPELYCTFANYGRRAVLVGENIDIYWTWDDGSDYIGSMGNDPRSMPGHYFRLEATPPKRRSKRWFTYGETTSRRVTIGPEDVANFRDGTLNVMASLELLEHDAETGSLESRHLTISTSCHFDQQGKQGEPTTTYP